MKIQIIYIATEKYNNYSEEFFTSFDKQWFISYDKVITVLTDTPALYEKYKESLNIEIIKIASGPYPCLNLMKFNNILSFIHDDADYVFYFDADTKLVDISKETETNFMNILNNDFIIIPQSVTYTTGFYEECYIESQRPFRIYDIEVLKNRCNEPEYSPLYSKLHIPDKTYVWAQTCMICAKTDVMKSLCEDASEMLNDMMRTDHETSRLYTIPLLFDESIINKIIYDYKLGKNMKYKFSVSSYSFCYEGLPNQIVIQKYGNTENKKHS